MQDKGFNLNNPSVQSNASEIKSNTKNEPEGRVIDESQYTVMVPKEAGPTAIGRGGDPLFRRIKATTEELDNLNYQVGIAQDRIQRIMCNKAAEECLDEENLKEDFFKISKGFTAGNKSYGSLVLIGFRTPTGVNIPRLKIFDESGECPTQVLSGPMAIQEIKKRIDTYNAAQNNYESLPLDVDENIEIQDYQGNV